MGNLILAATLFPLALIVFLILRCKPDPNDPWKGLRRH